MKKVFGFVLCCSLALVVFMSDAGKVTAQDATAPVRLDREKISGLGLTAIPPDAYKDILVAGQLNMKVATLFSGKELSVSIFECTPAKTDHRTRPNDSDEFVYVLSGKLILTEPAGTVHQFQAGDTLVLPAGYTGTWEMQGNYREIAITAKKQRAR
ncbi:MAG TPA: cupin domain-containing protein [Terriglobia bacterium]|nr:cupin domain-containing protein [Terriglobia bacterium]